MEIFIKIYSFFMKRVRAVFSCFDGSIMYRGYDLNRGQSHQIDLNDFAKMQLIFYKDNASRKQR